MDKRDPVPPRRGDLEIIETTYQGRRALVVRDSLGLIRDPVLLQGVAIELLGMLDAPRALGELRLELVRRRGGLLEGDDGLEELVRELDSVGLLQSPAFRARKKRLLADYQKLDVREASHAGAAYPAEPDRLRAYLDSILEETGGADSSVPVASPVAIVAPHIDLETARRAYARAYRALVGRQVRRVVLLGTGHTLEDGVFGLTDKDFVTPLGRVATDRAAVDRLRRAGDGCLAPSDIAHRREHSLEFELIFLQRILGPAFSLVPVLCGSVSQELARVSRAAEIPGVGGVLAAMRSLWEEDRSGTLFVAGADLSHIGPKFGHRERAVSLLPDARAHDQELLRAFTAGDASAFWAESRRVSDRYNVCGLSALAFLLEVFPGATGSLLDYDFWIEEETQSAVSFAAAALGAEGKGRGGGR